MKYRIMAVIVLFGASAAFALRAQQPAAPPRQPVQPQRPAAQPAPGRPAPSQPERPPAVETQAEEAAIRANAQKYVEAYNRHDSRTMAAMWSPDAVYMDPATGAGIVGRDEIAKHFDFIFAGSEVAKLAITIDAIDFVSPNVAVERGSAVVTYADHPPENSTYSAVHVKRDGQWLLDRVSETETPAPRPSNYESLRELEWMIGSWVDNNDPGVTIQTDCEWTKNRNFITRSFAVVIGDRIDMSGMQVIGWDAAAKQIRSWVFDSDGGFGEGKWTRKDDRWIIQSTAMLPDGGKATGVNIMTRLDDNAFTWQAVNRAVDGELLPNVPEVLIVRKPVE